MAKSRVFCFTQFTFDETTDDEYRKLVSGNNIRYIAYGLETCPKTGTLHRQGWVCYKTQKSTAKSNLARLNVNFNKAHFEPMYGSLQQNNTYCSKATAGVLQKFGDEPKQGDRNDLKDVVDRIGRGETSSDDICIEDPMFYHMYGRTLQKAEDILARRKWRTTMTKGIWYYGRTGRGKSHTCFDGYDPKDVYNKPLRDEWWDAYKGQKTVLFNEFRGQIPFDEILCLLDKWPHDCRRRNREPVPFLAETLIITSALHPREVFKDNCKSVDDLEQLIRRLEIWLINEDRSLTQQ